MWNNLNAFAKQLPQITTGQSEKHFPFVKV